MKKFQSLKDAFVQKELCTTKKMHTKQSNMTKPPSNKSETDTTKEKSIKLAKNPHQNYFCNIRTLHGFNFLIFYFFILPYLYNLNLHHFLEG